MRVGVHGVCVCMRARVLYVCACVLCVCVTRHGYATVLYEGCGNHEVIWQMDRIHPFLPWILGIELKSFSLATNIFSHSTIVPGV